MRRRWVIKSITTRTVRRAGDKGKIFDFICLTTWLKLPQAITGSRRARRERNKAGVTGRREKEEERRKWKYSTARA